MLRDIKGTTTFLFDRFVAAVPVDCKPVLKASKKSLLSYCISYVDKPFKPLNSLSPYISFRLLGSPHITSLLVFGLLSFNVTPVSLSLPVLNGTKFISILASTLNLASKPP